jgi:lipoprotein-anchoring transpeptidase ErfK/SrfK
VAVVALGLCIAGSKTAESSYIPSSIELPKIEAPKPLKRHVIVSIPDRKLAVLDDDQVVRTFNVAIGADVSPSPTGQFQIAHRLINPTYYHPGVVIPPGKDNPLGPRWVGLSQKGFGIHGTNQPRSIGKAASHGCIRMRNRDVEQLFEMVSVGDTVEIRGERDQGIARIFGESGNTLVAASKSTQTMAAAGSGQ